MIKIFFNQKCQKCQIAKSNLDEQNKEYTTCEYLKENIRLSEIEEILKKGNFASAEDILRKNEPEYKEFIEGKFLDEREIIGLILNHPNLLQRPIVVTATEAFIVRDEEALQKLMKTS